MADDVPAADEAGDVAGSGDVIVLDGVRKEFGSFVAVEHAGFAIVRGEFFSLLGPSGCGKTTLLKIIAGFEQPTQGRVLLEGEDVSGVDPHRRNVNTVFQQYALFPHMSVYDNVAFGLRAKRVPSADVRKRSMEMLEVVRLAEFARRRPAQLSGGQQQRVALARALVNLPSALLLDEPLAALDLKLREAMQIELKRIQREVGITFVFVTHDQGEALTMSDRIAVMSRGQVEQIGTPEEIYDRPASVFVAGFIGSANLLPGELESASAESCTVRLDSGVEVEVPRSTDAGVGDPVTIMLRPERLHLADGAVSHGRQLAGTLQDVIFQGAQVRMLVDLADGTEVVASADSVAAGARPGAPVVLEWGEEAPLLLRGRSNVVGATTTDVDEVQASLEGRELGEGQAVAEPPPERRLARRALLVGGGAVAGAAVVGAILALTGDGDSSESAGEPAGGTTPDGGTVAPGGAGGSETLGTGAEELRILNWQAYIDPSEDGEVGTVNRFMRATGIELDYSENFDDNDVVFNRELQPFLANDEAVDYDIVCPTNWLAARLKSLDWIEPLPLERIPNHANLLDRYVDQAWDQGARYNMPWQAGITGIAYNPDLTGRELRSVLDLLDAEFEGRVAMLTEMRDTVGLMMLALGADPAVVDLDGAMAAIDRIEEATNNGQIRAFTGNGYLRRLRNDDFIACLAWSGDIVQLQYDRPEIQFVIPEEGGMSWYDTMVIPKGSANGYAAADWMNYVYDPVQAARITYWVQYVSPVQGVRDELVRMGGDAATLADSPILFPDDEASARLNVFADLPEEVEVEINERFSTLIGG